MQLLTRDEFREGVFARDKHRCIMCGEPAQDAHHIVERKLWPDGGYYLANGAGVCGPCHILCEQTTISCDALRAKLGVDIVLPPHLYPDQAYDKWGNPILATGRRALGELMDDASVQKILGAGGFWPSEFDTIVKYPRTYHLPWSQGATDDDRTMANTKAMQDEDVVVTVKMDGENTTMTRDSVYSRSRDTESHWSRDWVRREHGRVQYEIPERWRLCGENLFAMHSIKYESLPSFFMGFSIWDGLRCLPFKESADYYDILGIPTVPVVYAGKFDQRAIEAAWAPFAANHEGYVVRPSRSFGLSEFRHFVGKYVRANHNQCHGNWHRSAERNQLARSA